jgi:hypothetical protein
MTRLITRNSFNPSLLRSGFRSPRIRLFVLSPLAQAQDFNTGVGDFALSNVTNGDGNKATGYSALFSDKGGSVNTASGYLEGGV